MAGNLSKDRRARAADDRHKIRVCGGLRPGAVPETISTDGWEIDRIKPLLAGLAESCNGSGNGMCSRLAWNASL